MEWPITGDNLARQKVRRAGRRSCTTGRWPGGSPWRNHERPASYHYSRYPSAWRGRIGPARVSNVRGGSARRQCPRTRSCLGGEPRHVLSRLNQHDIRLAVAQIYLIPQGLPATRRSRLSLCSERRSGTYPRGGGRPLSQGSRTVVVLIRRLWLTIGSGEPDGRSFAWRLCLGH